MASLNKAMLIGNLGADPELKYMPSAKAVCNLRIATTETWKDKSGQKQEKTEWHRVTAWGTTAENCAKYLSKGKPVYIEGRIETRQYEKNGEKRYATEIVADKVVFIGGGSKDGNAAPRDTAPSEAAPPINDDEIPFD
jgi:single-strand DNA-binding protein